MCRQRPLVVVLLVKATVGPTQPVSGKGAFSCPLCLLDVRHLHELRQWLLRRLYRVCANQHHPESCRGAACLKFYPPKTFMQVAVSNQKLDKTNNRNFQESQVQHSSLISLCIADSQRWQRTSVRPKAETFLFRPKQGPKMYRPSFPVSVPWPKHPASVETPCVSQSILLNAKEGKKLKKTQ